MKIRIELVSKATRKYLQFLVPLKACLKNRRAVTRLRIKAFLKLVRNSLQNKLIRLIGSY